MTLPLDRVLPRFAAALLAVLVLSITTRAENASYLALQPDATLGGSPASLLMQTAYINVPAGAVLSVHLLKGHQVITTSKLEFMTAYKSAFAVPVQVAAFLAPGTPTSGELIPETKYQPGITDLTPMAANPSQYQLFWSLTDGEIANSSRAILVGGTSGLSFIELAPLPSAASRQSDQKPGSVLFYQKYLSAIGSSNGNNTTISITNTSPTASGRVRMFFISAADCKPFEQAVCLAPQQTTSFVMSDFDPGTTGYCIAVACDAAGNPTQFNWLIGNAQLRQTSPVNSQFFDTTLSAIAVGKRTVGSLTATNNVAEMAFDDTTYDRLPAQLAADNIPSQGTTTSNANATVLSLYRPLSNLAGGTSSTSTTFTVNNNTGQSTTATQPIGCASDLRLSSLRLNPTLATILSAGKTGWIRISAGDNGPLIGAQFNSGQYASGASLRAITFALDYRISIPIRAPGC